MFLSISGQTFFLTEAEGDDPKILILYKEGRELRWARQTVHTPFKRSWETVTNTDFSTLKRYVIGNSSEPWKKEEAVSKQD